MPKAALKLCTYPGCSSKQKTNRCEKHRQGKEYDQRRVERARQEGGGLINSPEWRELRAVFLRRYPLCAHHLEKGQLVAANQVDHKIPHRGDHELFFDENNLQSLCASCHSTKTAREDGGFGRLVIG